MFGLRVKGVACEVKGVACNVRAEGALENKSIEEERGFNLRS